MLKEIGSEFWKSEYNESVQWHWWKACGEEKRYYVSGRSALLDVIYDIKLCLGNKKGKVYCPSYCCDSMLSPFLQQGIDVEFYTVEVKNNKIVYEFQESHSCNIILIMEYFGFHNERMHDICKKEKEKGNIVIQDITHSLLQEIPCSGYADYLIGSLRKWSGFAGLGIGIKLRSKYQTAIKEGLFKKFTDKRESAAKKKLAYITGTTGNKGYLEEFGEAEKILEKDSNVSAADKRTLNAMHHWDTEFIKNRRRGNYQILLEKIKPNVNVRVIFDDISPKDCPLFFPVQVKSTLRDQLRLFLIRENIYCPIHWPLTQMHQVTLAGQGVYKTELSLICDQRYNKEEMEREAEIFNSFFGD